MTKKSAARIARDNEKKSTEEKAKQFKKSVQGNKSWNELEDIYQGAVQLLQSHTTLASFATRHDLLSQIDDKATFVNNMQQLTGDLNTMSEELKKIHDSHAGKQGGANTPNDFIQVVEIFEMYNLFMERHQAVVIPTALYITEQLEQAEKKLAALAAQAEQNGATVIEVEAVEVTEGKDLVAQAASAIETGEIVDVATKGE